MIVELGFIVVSILHFILETDYYIHRYLAFITLLEPIAAQYT